MGGMSASPETDCAASSGRGWIAAGVIGFAVVAGVVSDKAFSQTPDPNVQVFAANAREGGNDGNFVFNITDALSFDARIQFDLAGTADSSDYTLSEGGGVTVGNLTLSGSGGEFTVAAGTVQVVLNLAADADDDDDDETLSLTVTGLAFDTDRDGSFADDSDPDGRNAATATLIDATSPPLPPRFSLSAPTRAVVSEATPTETSVIIFTLHNLTPGNGSTTNTVFLELNGRNPDSNTAFAEWGIDYSLAVTHSGSTQAPVTGISLITFFPSFELPNNVNTAEITVTPIADGGHEAVPEIILIRVTEVHLRPPRMALHNFRNCSPGGNATDPTVCTSVGARQTIAVTDAEDAPAGTERAVLTFDTGSRTRSGPQSDTPGEPGNIFLNADRAHRFVRDGADAGDPSIDESVGRIFSLHLSNLGGRNEQVARFRYNLIDVSENPSGLFVVGSALTINRSARLPPGRWDDEQAIRTASLRNIAAISDSTLTFPSFEFEHNDITSTFGPQSFIFEVYQVDFGIGTVGTGDRGNSSFTSNGDSVIPDEPYRLRVTVIDNDNQTYATAIESVQVSRSGLREGESIVVRVTLNGRAGGVENIIPYTLDGTGIEAADIDDDNADGDGNPLSGGVAVPFYRDYGETVITAAADGLFEGDERMTIRTTGSNSIALNAVAANNAATIALMDGDRLPVPTELVGFSIPDGSSRIAEDSSVVVTATLDHPVPQGDPAILIPYTLTGAGVTADDFSNHDELRGDVTIATGAIKGMATIISADDALDESGDKTVTVALGTLPNNSAGVQLTENLGDITFVITGDEASTVPVVTLTRAPPTVTEGATGQFMLNLGTVPGGVATVTYTLVITGPNASANDIIVIPSIDGELVVNGTGDMATINLNIGTPSRLTIAVLANRDNDPDDELVTLTISRIEIADIILGPDDLICTECDPPGTGALSIAIEDNDEPNVTLTRDRASVTEGTPGLSATFTLALRNIPEPNGRSTITSTITISGDDAHESDIIPVSSGPVIRVSLTYAGSTSRRTAPIGPGSADFFTLDINNHAADYTLNISPHPRGDDDTTNEIVTYAITEILLPGLGEFDLSNIICEDCDPPGSSSLSITLLDAAAPRVTRFSDAVIDEGNSDSLTRSSNGFSLEIHSLPDGHGDGTFSLTIPQGDPDDPSIPIPIVDRDYEYLLDPVGLVTMPSTLTPENPTLDITIPASVIGGDRFIEIRVVFRAIDDNYDEAEQTMAIIGDVVFPNASSGSLTLTPSSSTVTIRMFDNDEVRAELNKGDRAPVEGVSTPSTFTVTITQAPDADAEVTYTLEGGVGTKYTANADGTNNAGILNANGTFTIPRNNITGTNTGPQGGAQGAAEVVINITPQNDADSNNEDVTLTINSITFDNGSDHGNLSAGDIGGTGTINGAQILTIIDNTEPSATPAADYDGPAEFTITEGEEGTESTLTLTDAPGTANVAFTFSGGTASAGAESDINFSVSDGGDLTFNADGTTGTFTIPMGTAAAVLTFIANTDSDSNGERITFTVTGITFDNGAFVSELPGPLTIRISDPTRSVITVTVSNPTIAVGEMTIVTFALSNFPVLVGGIDVVRTEFSFVGFPSQGAFNPPSDSTGATTTMSRDYDLAFSGDFSDWRIDDRNMNNVLMGELIFNVPVLELRDDAAANVVMAVTAKAASALIASHSRTRSFGAGNSLLRTHEYDQAPSLRFTITEAFVPPTARLSATDTEASEVNNDPAVATLTLINVDDAGDAIVSFELREAAIFDTDYLLDVIFPDNSEISLSGSGVVDLPARFREVRFRITPIADALSEPSENAQVIVTNVAFPNTDVPAITTRSTATMTIVDYGTLPTAQLSLDGNSEINEGGSTSVFTLRLDDAPNGNDIAVVAYSLTVTGGNDPANDDITAAFGLAAAGNTPDIGGTGGTFTMDVANRIATATLTIASSADDNDNTGERVTFTVTGIIFDDIGDGTNIPDALRPVPSPLSLNINDDDPTVQIFGFHDPIPGRGGTRSENQNVEFAVFLSAPLPEVGTIRYTILPADSGNSIDGNDVSSALNFGANNDNFRSVPAGNPVRLDLDIADDNRVEQNAERGRLNIISITWGTHTIENVGSPQSFTITDNDGITLALDADEYRVRDNAGTLGVAVIATANPIPSTHNGVVLDRAVAATLASTDGSARVAEDDYDAVNETLTYDAGSSLDDRTVSITINDDGDTGDETFTLALEKDDRAVTLVAPDAATVTITPNTSASYAPGTDTDIALTEGGASTERTLTLVNAPNATATVSFEFRDGTVAGGGAPDPSLIFTTGEDPTTPTINPGGTGGSFTIPRGMSSILLTFRAPRDANDNNETIRFTINDITFAGDDSVTDLGALSVLVIRITDTAIFFDSRLIDVYPMGSEVNNTPATATLTLVGPDVSGEATASFALRGSATFGTRSGDGFDPDDADYLLDIVIGGVATPATSSTGSLILPENLVREVHFRITPIADADDADEGDENVAIAVSGITLGGTALPDRAATLTITDYDPLPTAALSLSDNSVFEGGNTGVFSLGLRNAPVGIGIAEVTYTLVVTGDNPETTDITAAFGEAASGATAVVGTGENPSPNTFMMDVDNFVVSTATLIITTADDADTVNETVTFAVTDVTFDDIGTGTDIESGDITPNSQTLDIIDDDPASADAIILRIRAFLEGALQ